MNCGTWVSCRWSLLLIVTTGALSLFPARAVADPNLLCNPDLIEGTAGMPSGWRGISQRYLDSLQAAEMFEWHHAAGKPGELCLDNWTRSVMRWSHTINLVGSVYHLSGEMRTIGLVRGFDFATIGIQLTNPHGPRRSDRHNMFGLSWSDADPSSNWQKGGLFFRIGTPQRTLEVVCKLEGRGSVCFREIKLIKSSPPEGSEVIDLDDYPDERELEYPRPYSLPNGRYWVLAAVASMLMAVAALGWLALRPH